DDWLREALGDPGPFELIRLTGGNSNETLELRSPTARRILRRPPAATVDRGAHDMARELRVLKALAATDVPAPLPLAFDAGSGAPVREAIDGMSLADARPPAHAASEAGLGEIGTAVVDALAALHNAPWAEVGLADFGRPAGFLQRQVGRWQAQRER